jgi:hypothetical protein
VLGMAFLLGVAGYPASAVGVPGDARSNLDPPSLVALAVAAAQIGVLLVVRARLSGAPGREAGGRGGTGMWPAVEVLNRAALPIYLQHQSVLILVTAAAALIRPAAPGLLTAPDGPVWAAQRLAWLPVFAAVLAAVVRFRPARKRGGRHAGRARAH